jgi:hypothetical protein
VNNPSCTPILTGVTRLVYTLVQGHIRQLKGVPPQIDELAAEAIEEYGEDNGEEEPLLQSTTSNTTNHV